MTTYDKLKKIIPPDQALANQALSRSLRQVKKIFDTDLPSLAQVVGNLETNKDLNLINSLDTPIPSAVGNFWANTFPTGTGPGGAVTTNDVIGVAAGATVNTELPVVTTTLVDLNSLGALDSLTANGGTSSSVNNGIYTVMAYCLAGAFTSDDGYGNYTVTIPLNNNIPGTPVVYGSSNTPNPAISTAFSTTLIPNANIAINTIANTYSSYAANSNAATDQIANQLVINQDNCIDAGLNIGLIVQGDFANANIVSNANSTALNLITRFHDIGLDVSEGGPAQFFEATANLTNITGQAVVASMREGRNIATLNAVGINLDTQLVDLNPTTPIANNLGNAQYSVSEARANIII